MELADLAIKEITPMERLRMVLEYGAHMDEPLGRRDGVMETFEGRCHYLADRSRKFLKEMVA